MSLYATVFSPHLHASSDLRYLAPLSEISGILASTLGTLVLSGTGTAPSEISGILASTLGTLVLSGTGTAPPIDLSTLYAYYRFESGALTTDRGSNAQTLTNVGSVGETTGKIGGAANLSGSNYFQRSAGWGYSNTNGITVAFWTSANAPVSGYRFFVGHAAGYGAGNLHIVYRVGWAITTNTEAAPWARDAVSAAPAGTYRSVIAWWDPVATKLGIQVDGGSPVLGNAGATAPTPNGQHNYVGQFGGGGYNADGGMDELVISQHVWSATERAAWWNGGAGINLNSYL